MNQPRFPWTRLILSLSGIAVVIFKWWWDTKHLYVLPGPALPVFQSITNNANYVIGAIIIFAVTGKLIYDWKNSTASEAVSTLAEARQKIEETKTVKVDERIVQEMERRYQDDPSYRPLSTLPDNDGENFR